MILPSHGINDTVWIPSRPTISVTCRNDTGVASCALHETFAKSRHEDRRRLVGIFDFAVERGPRIRLSALGEGDDLIALAEQNVRFDTFS